MTKSSPTPLWDELHQKVIDRLLTEAPPFEFLILKAHLLVERTLDILIDGALQQPSRLRKGRRLTFEFKVALAQALGILPSKYVQPINALNRTRNNTDGYQLTIKDLLDLRIDWDAKLVARIKRDFTTDPTDATSTATAILVWNCLELVDELERRDRQKP